MRKHVTGDFEGTAPGSILNMPNMKYFPGHNALYIKYISGSRAHDKIYMVHRDDPPNLPSPSFFISMVTQPGSSDSMNSFKGPKTTRAQGHNHTNTSVTSILSLCPGGALYIN